MGRPQRYRILLLLLALHLGLPELARSQGFLEDDAPEGRAAVRTPQPKVLPRKPERESYLESQEEADARPQEPHRPETQRRRAPQPKAQANVLNLLCKKPLEYWNCCGWQYSNAKFYVSIDGARGTLWWKASDTFLDIVQVDVKSIIAERNTPDRENHLDEMKFDRYTGKLVASTYTYDVHGKRWDKSSENFHCDKTNDSVERQQRF
jgi:hypothetical protein